MRSIHVTSAIVLRSWPVGESDKIVSFFTALHGKVTGIAKGAKRSRRRFVNTLELFNWVTLRFQDRPHSALAFVHACDLVRAFKNLSAQFEKIVLASYVVEIVDVLTGEREENRPIFEHLSEALTFLEENEGSLPFLASFEFKLLKLAGYQPTLERCCRCGKPLQAALEVSWRFSLADGGILCPLCSTLRKGALSLSPEALSALRELQKANGHFFQSRSLSPSAIKESHSVLLQFIQSQTNKELKSARFVAALSI